MTASAINICERQVKYDFYLIKFIQQMKKTKRAYVFDTLIAIKKKKKKQNNEIESKQIRLRIRMYMKTNT